MNKKFKEIATPEQWEEFKSRLDYMLREGKVTVIFDKKDGERRVMTCTLDPNVVPQVEKKTKQEATKVNEDICPVFDLDKQAWRSFRYDTIYEVQFETQ